MSHPISPENLRKSVRKYIFDHFEEHTTAPVLEQIMRRFGLDRASAFKVLEDLQSARHIALLNGTQRILMAFPFSGIVTPFRVRVAGKEREYFANCAWDAVAIHVALRKEEWISSFCHHCSEEIQIHLKDQRVVAQQSDKRPLVYLALPASKWWENIVLTCANNMVFFSSKDHLAAWNRSGAAIGEPLTIEQTLRLSVPIYETKMNLDYARPTREQTIAHFQSLGFTSEFWKIQRQLPRLSSTDRRGLSHRWGRGTKKLAGKSVGYFVVLTSCM